MFDRFWRGDAARSHNGHHCGLGLALCQRVNVCGRVFRIADLVLLYLSDVRVHEIREQRAHDVDPFDGAATLSAIVEGAIHQVGHGEIEVRVFQDQRRVFAAELQPHIEQLRGGLPVDLAPAFHRSGK